jgi:hypothetical protein
MLHTIQNSILRFKTYLIYMNNLGNLVSYAFFIPSFAIIAACIYYLIRKVTPQGALLLIGSLGQLLSSLFYRIGMPYLTNTGKSYQDLQGVLLWVGVLGLLAACLFAVGLLLLIVEVTKKPKMYG